MRAMKKKRRIVGTLDRHRLSVFRSLNNIYAQIIDDAQGKTIASASSIKLKKGGDIASAKEVGKVLAEKALAKGIKKVVFDRGSLRYHGRIKALAETAREGGLLF
jgi:large subunit ribosomal protein L18